MRQMRQSLDNLDSFGKTLLLVNQGGVIIVQIVCQDPMDTCEQAEAHFHALSLKYNLTFLPSRGNMSPWLTTYNVDRVVAYCPHREYLFWRKGEKPRQILKTDIVSFLLI